MPADGKWDLIRRLKGYMRELYRNVYVAYRT